MKDAKAPPTPPNGPEPAYLVLTEDAEGLRRGMLVPNTPELAEKFVGKTRPATKTDIAVSAVEAYRSPAP